MTVAATITQARFTGNGATASWPFGNKVFSASDLVVTLIDPLGNLYTFASFTNVTLGLAYNVSNVDVDTGSTVNLTNLGGSPSPLTALWVIDIRSAVPETQSTSIKNQGSFLPELHEEAFDRLTREIQDLLRMTYTYGIHAADIETVAWPALPAPALRVNSFLFFDSNGLPAVGTDIPAGSLTQALFNSFVPGSWSSTIPTKQTPAEIAASITPTILGYLPYDLRRYGADPTGVTPSDAALAAAIAVCGTAGGTIRAPNGAYTFANQINLNGKSSIVIQGDGVATGGAIPGTQFIYSGTGSGIWITMLDAVGIQIRGIQLAHSSASFTGTYIRCGNGGTRDAAYCGVFDATIGSSVSATTHLNLDKAINWACENVNFLFGNPSVKGQSSAGGSYSNVVNWLRCYWHSCSVAAVYDGGQAWKFDSCNFEQLVTGGAGAFLSSNGFVTSVAGLTFINCWLGDATVGGNWIDVSGQSIQVVGCYIGGDTLTTAINLRHVHGISIEANTFSNHMAAVVTADNACAQISVRDNVCNSVILTTIGMPLAFTGTVSSGATSATLAASWTGITGGYQVVFSDGETKTVTLTNGATTATWSVGLANTVTASALVGAGYNVVPGSLDVCLNFGLTPALGHVRASANGYEAGPRGIIRQFGSITLTIGTPLAVLFATNGINFPNACFHVFLTMEGPPGTANAVWISTTATTTGFSVNGGGTAGTVTVHWEAVGN